MTNETHAAALWGPEWPITLSCRHEDDLKHLCRKMRHYLNSRSSMADTCFRTWTGTKIFLSTHWSVCGLESSTNLWVFERVQNEKAHDRLILSLLDSVKRKKSFVCSLTLESNKRKKEFEKRENEIQWAVWNTVSAPPATTKDRQLRRDYTPHVLYKRDPKSFLQWYILASWPYWVKCNLNDNISCSRISF